MELLPCIIGYTTSYYIRLIELQNIINASYYDKYKR